MKVVKPDLLTSSTLVTKLTFISVCVLDGGINWGWVDKGLETIHTK